MPRPTSPLALWATVAILAATGFATGAQAQKRPPRSDMAATTLARIQPDQMAAVLRDRGNPAEVIRENNRTRVRTEVGNRRTSVHFYACTDEGCQSIQYRTVFRRHERFTLAFVNAWNLEKRFAKAYLDSDGDLILEWDVDFDGGVTVGFVSESVATFQTMLTAFDRFTPRNDAPAAPDAGNGGRSLSPGMPGGGRSTTPGLTPAVPGQPQPSGKGSTGDVPGERRT
ncbi:MAG: YbjN domain-containing protein [Phreatobacter sp.]|uniref:YbjN domain-containing protein n=1 Tax=Phreatobacter sp. TaxID=1966341 RepID=UPI0027352135|nr:YbjN domain-containing protein [Phreatobacter sp.]MDP2803909.1 YbjN domain-containing protein [Phreatobacter sp.]